MEKSAQKNKLRRFFLDCYVITNLFTKQGTLGMNLLHILYMKAVCFCFLICLNFALFLFILLQFVVKYVQICNFMIACFKNLSCLIHKFLKFPGQTNSTEFCFVRAQK